MFPSIPLGTALNLPTYFLLISVGTILSSYWFIHRARTAELEVSTAIDLNLVALIAGFVGARGLHVFFEAPQFYRENPLQTIYVWNGGFVFFGGVIGAFVACVLFCAWKREPFWLWADLAAPTLALAYALGRLACFFQGCCYGKSCDLPWAVDLHGAFRHPTQIYASLYESVVLAVLTLISSRVKTPGLLFNIWLLLHAFGRLGMESLRDDPRGDLILGISVSSFLALVFALFASVNIVSTQLQRRRA